LTTAPRRLLALVSIVALAAIGFVALRSGSHPVSPAAHMQGGALVASLRAEPRGFNRYVTTDSASDWVSLLTHARLARINRATHELEPSLAERWDSAPDGLTHTLHLRRDVTFSDGAPFSSADVLFAFEAIYDEATGSSLADVLRINGQRIQVAATGDHTIVLRFPSPYAPGLRLLDHVPILPRHRLEPALRRGELRAAWDLSTPPEELTGLGPFVLSEYVPGQRLVFTRNPRYWRVDDDGVRLPYLDRLTLEIVPDQNTELLRLEAGTIDFTQSEIRPEDYAALRRAADAGRLRMADVGVGLDPSFLWFNLNPRVNDARGPWFRSRDFRRAISHAVDRESFANVVFLGTGVPVYGPITPGNRAWFSPAVPTTPFDPDLARRLLAGLGLEDRTGDGMLEDPDGRPVRFTLLTQRGNTERERGAAFIQEDLRRAGLAVDVVALDVGSLIDRYNRADYEAIYFGTNSTDTDPGQNLTFWLSSGSFHIWHPNQASPATDWERRIDELMQQQVATSDGEARRALFEQVQRIFAEELPVLYFVAPRIFVATSSRVTNATPVLLRPPVLWNPDVLAVAGPAATEP
jgi:peptide/nickel transport system substrate-binding protein